MRHTNLIPISAKLVLILDSILLNRLTYCQQVWHYCKASDSRKMGVKDRKTPRERLRGGVQRSTGDLPL